MGRPFVDPIVELPIQVRVVTARPGGAVVGSDVLSLAHFGGILPNVGDVFKLIRTADDYDSKVVQRRYFITEPDHHVYWTLVTRKADAAPEFTRVVRNALAVSDYRRALHAKRPMKEMAAKLRKINGEDEP